MATTPPQIQSTDPIRVQAPVNPLYTGLLFILAVLLAWFLVWPKWVDVQAKRVMLEQLRVAEQTFGQQEATLNGLLEQLNASQDDIKVLDEALPLDNRLSKVYLLVEAFAKTSGLTLVNISADTGDSLAIPGAVAAGNARFNKQGQLFTSTMSLSMIGQYDQFVTFLTFVEQNRRILDVSSVDIAPGENAALSFRVKLKSYFYTTGVADAGPK